MSLWDMLFGGGTQQLDPYTLAAQLGATPRTIQQPQGALTGSQSGQPLPPTSISQDAGFGPPPEMRNVPNPAYVQLQQQVQDALAQQKSNALNMGLLNAGATMLGARGPGGYPAGFGAALGQGIQAGTKEYGDYLTRSRELSKGLLESQAQGQQIKLNEFELATKDRLVQMYGVSDPQIAQIIAASRTVAAQQTLAKEQSVDPRLTAEQRQRAATLASSMTGATQPMTAEAYTDAVFGKAMSPMESKFTEAQIKHFGTENVKNLAMADLLGAKTTAAEHTGGVSLKDRIAVQNAALKKVDEFVKTRGTMVKALGFKPDTARMQEIYAEQFLGIPPDLPTGVPDDGKPHPVPLVGGGVEWWMWDSGELVPVGAPAPPEPPPAE